MSDSKSSFAGRIPPHSIEAEEYLLSCCLLDGADVLARCEAAGIKPASFYLDAHGLVYRRLIDLHKRQAPIDVAVLAEELKASREFDAVGGYAFLTQVSSRIPTTAQAGYFIDKVREQHVLRETIRAATQTVEDCYNFTGEADQLLKLAGARLAGIELGGGSIASRLEAARLNPEAEPPPLRVIYTLNGVCIATPGNVVAACAAAKAGKTALIGACIAAPMSTDKSGDFLGLMASNPNGHAVVHVDTEQAPADHWRVIDVAKKRAHVDIAPAWLHSYATAGWSATDRRAMLPHMLRLAKKAHGGVLAVFLDGVADFINDPNDGEECFPFVDSLQALAVEHDCPIFGVLHLNPGTEKSRGHLGSQLERRAETNLILERDADTGRTVVYSTKQRRAPILKADGPCFRWDDTEQMHVSVETVRSARDSADADAARELANEVFGMTSSLTYSALIEAIKTTCKCSERTAGRKFGDMRDNKIIAKFPPNRWAKSI